jgi:hypothetical protein
MEISNEPTTKVYLYNDFLFEAKKKTKCPGRSASLATGRILAVEPWIVMEQGEQLEGRAVAWGFMVHCQFVTWQQVVL